MRLCLLLLLATVFCGGMLAARRTYTNPQNPRAAQEGAKPQKIQPQIPSADRFQKNKVFLENANSLVADERISTDYMILRGDVQFRRGNMFMYCDSAYFYEGSSSLDAFGNVKMTQGDTLFVYADILHYYGEVELAELRYNVRMERPDMVLITDSLDYDIRSNVGYYFDGGTIVDKKNNTELSSQFGRYELRSKQAEFSTDVRLLSDKYEMSTHLLNYNTGTHMADIVTETYIVSDSNVIVTSRGRYNTSADEARLFNRSVITAKDGRVLTGDTLYYNRAKGYGEAFGKIVVTDPVHKVILDGDYGYHNENTHESFATKRARAREFSQKDTLYLHADTLRTRVDADSLRHLEAISGVRFYRVDLQGVCDTMTVCQGDSILRMHKDAMVWSGDRQIWGNEINVHLNDSTADWATLPNNGFAIEHLGEEYYNQLEGKKMKAYFEDKELRKLEVSGNVKTIFYPMEKDSTYNKLVTAESSFLTINLKPKQEVEKVIMWPEVVGKVTPLFLVKRSQLYLQGFNWEEGRRPQHPDDIFDTSGIHITQSSMEDEESGTNTLTISP
ncbi:MAG: hypothetical protein IK092_01280 [Muribaculaceae bacterium]|nr:hypothetical protein [Muribaculaceae bacterium]